MMWVLKCGPPGLRVVWICVQYYILSVDSSPRACRAPARVGRIRRLMRMRSPSGAAHCAQEADAVVERDAGLTQRRERQVPPRGAAAEPRPPRVRAAAHQRRETTPFVVRIMMLILVSRVVCPTSPHCCPRSVKPSALEILLSLAIIRAVLPRWCRRARSSPITGALL